ncbi:MAG: tetratricopeptide repeat protein [Limisphaerales bacterium]
MAEKSLNDIPRALREQFDRGMAAYNKQNLGYAVTLFTDVLKKEPAFYECREALRAAQFRKGGKSGGLFKRFLGQAHPVLAKAQIALRSNPSEALHSAEEVLNDDPRNNAAHELLARAAMSIGLPRTAVLSLEIVFKATPADRGVAMRLAQALVAAGQVERADRIYSDLLAANPADLEVARAYKDLGARRTIHEKGYAEFGSKSASYRDALKDKEEAVTLEQESRTLKAEEVSDRLLAEYQERLAREPGNPKVLRTIADLHATAGRHDDALAVYQQILDLEGRKDPALEKAVADVRLSQFNARIDALDPSEPEYPSRLAQLERERADFELADCKSRVERFPTDLAIRFELGQLCFRLGRFPEAIQELQKAQSHPHHRLAAMGLLARCFARRGMNDLAARTLQNALKEKPVFDEEKKELLYELGVVLEKMGKASEAIEQFKMIYENDIGFRDTAARVDAHYAAQAGSIPPG